MVVALLSAALLQVQSPPAPQQYRLEILPRDPVVIAQDTLRLRPRLLDASGQPVTAEFRFQASGGARFEGRVDSTGLVRSGSTGTIPVTVTAQVPGQPAVSQRVDVRMIA